MSDASLLESECNFNQCTLQEIDKTEQNIEAQFKSENQAAFVWGLIFFVLGLVIILTPFVKALQKFHRAIAPRLVMFVPVIVGLTAGFVLGFAVSFRACFKQDCSPAIGFLPIILPLFSLLLSTPAAIAIRRRQKTSPRKIQPYKPLGWLIVGGILVFFSLAQSISTIRKNNSTLDQQKQRIEKVRQQNEQN